MKITVKVTVLLSLSFLFIQSTQALVPNDAEYVYQQYLKLQGAEQAWELSVGNRQVVVAVIDTGVDVTHQDLSDNIWINSGEIPDDGLDNDRNGYIDDYYGWDALIGRGSGLASFSPDEINKLGINHGTIVAGIIGAVGNNALGTTGVAWQVKIMPVKALGKNGEGSTKIIAQAIDYAIRNHADIINLSFVGEQTDSDLQSALQHAIDAGILVVNAAGNDNGVNLNSSPRFPICSVLQGGAGAILGVSAVDSFLQRATFANYGDKCVDISTIGVGLKSTRVKYKNPLSGDQFLTVGGLDGTSVAAPVAAGAAVLVKSLLPQAKGKKIADILIKTGQNINDYNLTLPPGALGRFLQIGSAVAEAKRLADILKARQIFFLYQQGDKYAVGYDKEGQLVSPLMTKFGSAALDSVTEDLSRDEPTTVYAFKDGRLTVVQSDNIISSWYPFGNRFYQPVKVIFMKSNGNDVLGVMPKAYGADETQVWGLDGRKLGVFKIYNDKIKSGYNLAKIDWDKDGTDEILVARNNRKSDIRLYDQRGRLIKKWDNPFNAGLTLAALSDQGQPVVMVAESVSYRAQVAILNNDTNKSQHIFGTINTHGLRTEINLLPWQDKQFINYSRVAFVYKNNREAGVKFYSPEGVLRNFFISNKNDRFLGILSQGGKLE